MSSLEDVSTYVTRPQARALQKIGSDWITAAKLGEYMCVMWELYQKDLVEIKMTKCKVLWRRA